MSGPGEQYTPGVPLEQHDTWTGPVGEPWDGVERRRQQERWGVRPVDELLDLPMWMWRDALGPWPRLVWPAPIPDPALRDDRDRP